MKTKSLFNFSTLQLCALLSLLAGLVTFTGCKTTSGAPDPVKTEKVKAVAETVSTMALRRALTTFTNDADNIALYAGAVGSIFCDMQSTRRFNPETLEEGIAQMVLPYIADADLRLYLADARDILKLTYRQFYADRFNAELPPNEWPAAVADIFCNSIDRALVDSGRPGIKTR